MTDRRTRRDFMGLTVAGAAGALAPSWLGATPPVFGLGASAALDPDLVVVNAKIYTMHSALPRAQAFAVSNGRFVTIGTSAEMRSLARKRTQLIDAKGMDARTPLHCAGAQSTSGPWVSTRIRTKSLC